MKIQLSGLLKAAALTACIFTVIPNALAESADTPALGQESDVRIELLTALELQRSVAESLGRDDLVARLDKSIDEVTYASEAEIAPIEGAVDEFRNQADALQQLELVIHEASAGRAPSSGKLSISTMAQYSNTTNSVIPSSTSLTGPDYYTGILCIGDFENGVRNDTDAVLAANIALSVAKVAWSAAEVLCGLDAVALASGGVGTIICSAAAALVGTAEEIMDGLSRCDATVDEAHLDAAFNRAEDNFELNTHIHSDLSDIEADLASHDADINLQISTHDTDINTQISTHDTDIKSQLTTHDTEIKSQVTTHDTEIKSQVATHDTDIRFQVATHDTDLRVRLMKTSA